MEVRPPPGIIMVEYYERNYLFIDLTLLLQVSFCVLEFIYFI